MNDRARAAWRETTLRVWSESYVLVQLPLDAAADAAKQIRPRGSFAHLLIDGDEASLTIERDLWASSDLVARAREVAGPFRVITFDVELDMDLCGYLAPAAVALADAGIPIVPQCGFSRDHLLISQDHIDEAVRVLRWLIDDSCRS